MVSTRRRHRRYTSLQRHDQPAVSLSPLFCRRHRLYAAQCHREGRGGEGRGEAKMNFASARSASVAAALSRALRGAAAARAQGHNGGVCWDGRSCGRGDEQVALPVGLRSTHVRGQYSTALWATTRYTSPSIGHASESGDQWLCCPVPQLKWRGDTKVIAECSKTEAAQQKRGQGGE